MTPFRCFTVRVFVVAFLLISLSAILRAQGNDARITGIVTDPSKAIIRAAKVDLVNVDTGVHYPAVTNGSGIYSVSGQVGNYRIEVEHVGFKTVIAPGIVLHTQDVLEINFEMAIGSTSETVTVSAGATNDSPAVSMTVTREFVENMPLNGQSFQDLIQLAPGTVAATSSGNSTGYYSIDGQRTDANNFTVDGVSANGGGVSNRAAGGSASMMAGSTPLQTILGTTQSLASIDSLQEFTIQTSSYTAEYGRNPGGQVQFTTRSGTNDMHGTLFEYFRNTDLDANSYANDYYGEPQSAEHQNDFGGTVGGPLIVPKLYSGKDKTFYFFSYEGLRLILPDSESEYVPTQAFRSWASPYVQPLLNASPLPNPGSPGNQDGCTITDPTNGQPTACDALFFYTYSYPNNVDNISLRIDQALGRRLHAFVRYADTPSSITSGAEEVNYSTIDTRGWTAGLSANISAALINEFRFNYTHDGEGVVGKLRSIGGSIPFARDLVIPAAYDGPYAGGTVEGYVPNSDLSLFPSYGGTGTLQRQYQFIDNVTWVRGVHAPKFGVDFRRVASSYTSGPYTSTIYLQSLADIQNGYATSLQVSNSAPGAPVIHNFSLYAQDHWKITPRLSIDYGVRWEVNPSPSPSNGFYPVTLTSDNLATATLAPIGTKPYKTYYDKVAPRLGFVWNAIPSQAHALTLRGGFGIFYDTGQGIIGSAYASTYPFQVNGPTLSEVPFPLASTVLAPPSLNVPLTPPYPYLTVSSPELTLPYTEQWSLSVDEALNSKNTLTVSYVGNNGRKLLFDGYYSGTEYPQFAGGLVYANNIAQSSYNALQILDVGRVTAGLDLIASFTFAHALDNAYENESAFVPEWGNSNNDIRRALNLALNYQTTTRSSSRLVEAVTHGWLFANRFSAQSGVPFIITQDEPILPNGTQAQYFPDLIAGVPIYLHGRASFAKGQRVVGNWRLNPDAFACVPTNTGSLCSGTPIRQGTLGRNYLRGPSFWTLNTALQRSFPVYERLHLNFRAEAFNVFNHPNFGAVMTNIRSSDFGQLFPDAATLGAHNQLYAMGGARSLQLSLKLQF